MNKPLIIGFTGYAKAGKDTAAKAIHGVLENMNVRSDCLSFAEPIRQIGEIFGYDYEQMTNQDLKESYMGNLVTGVTPRKFMQLVGSEMFRKNLHPDIWVKLLESKLDINRNEDAQGEFDLEGGVWTPRSVYFITDVRFENEAAMIKSHGGFIIKIDRTNMAASGNWRNHESEKYIDTLKVDTIWYNNPSTAIGWGGEAIRNFADFTELHKIGFNIQ